MDSDDTDEDKAQTHRPMNAFLLFCKQHRPIVREKYPQIENRSVTKILGEWWSNLAEEDKSPYTSLASQYKEAFMKANPEFRWHKMPPGSAESLPPSNAKPSTPSPANGMACSMSSLLNTTNPVYSSSQDSVIPTSSPCAPKPFKKRYLASQQSSADSLSPGSSFSSAGVSPEAARACEALMELARNESGSRSSEGSERRASPSDTPPLQTLREAVWSKVAGTLLKQEEDKLVVPPRDCPMNLTNQCTIRGQQIIEHIIENILSIPMNGPLDPTSEPITFSVNNNQERESSSRSFPPVTHSNGDVGDSIKASIYESLKNDLLKGKVTPLLPVTASSRTPAVPRSSHSSPTVSPTSARQRPAKKAEACTLVSSSPSGQDVLRLLGAGQLPINVGNSAITITKTPRVTLSSPSNTSMSFPVTTSVSTSSASSSPVSLSLTRTGPTRFPTSFSLNGGVPVLLSPQTGLVLSSPGSLVLSGIPGRQGPGDCVLLSPVQHVAGSQVMLGPGHSSPHLLLAGTKLVLAPSPQHSPPASSSTSDPVNLSIGSRGGPKTTTESNLRTVETSPLVTNTSPKKIETGPKVTGTSPKTIETSPKMTVTSPKIADISPRISETSSKIETSPRMSEINPRCTETSPRVTETGATKRPLQAESIGEERRSSRTGRGRRYQEFIEDISNTKKKRRSHRSGEETSEPEVEMETLPSEEAPSSSPLVTASSSQQHVHWKKMRTASLGARENTQAFEPSSPKQTLANQETSITANQQFDLDAKMEKMEPLKFPDKGKASSSSMAKATSSRCSARQAQTTPTSKAFDSRLNKKTR